MNKKEIKRILEKEGEARGVVFKTDADFVRKKEGSETLKRIEKKIESFGVSLEYEKIDSMRFYPIGWRVLSLLAVKEVVGFERDEIKGMCREAPKTSIVVKMFFRFFFSFEKTLAQASRMWRKHYTIGNLKTEGDKEKREIVIMVEDFEVHPVLCSYLEGYFSTISEMIVNEEVKSEITACPFKNDNERSHVYKFTW